MRRMATVFAFLLFAILPTLAHADQDFRYAGFVIVNGEDDTLYDDYTTIPIHVYRNEPVRASLTIHEIGKESDPFFVGEDLTLDLPVLVGPAVLYSDRSDCVDSENCVYIDYETDFFYDPIPHPELILSGYQDYFHFNSDGLTVSEGSETYEGTLHLVTADAPEPSSLALIGTGVLGFAGIVQRRKRLIEK